MYPIGLSIWLSIRRCLGFLKKETVMDNLAFTAMVFAKEKRDLLAAMNKADKVLWG